MRKKKKFVFNWGHGIAVFFSLFVITTISILVLSFTKTFDLQTENYYQEELAFEAMITKKKNVLSENLSLQVTTINKGIEIEIMGLKDKSAVGSVTVYRPSDKRLDLLFELEVDENGKQRIRHDNFQAGLYSVKIDFKSKSKPFFLEKEFTY